MGALIESAMLDPRGRPALFATTPAARPGWELLASVPVPLRHRIRDGIADMAAQSQRNGAPPLRWHMPMGQGGRSPFQRLRWIKTLADYPDMLVSAEYGNVFSRSFHDRFVATGEFNACQPETVAPVFKDCGLVDPLQRIGVFAVAPFVMLVDQRRLDGLPVPRHWGDLLNPAYGRQVVFGGWRRDEHHPYRDYNKFFLLAMAQEFGIAGIRRLARNMAGLMHSAQIPRLAGTDASPGGIYILPWSLAEMCPRRAHTRVVWPADGALAYPLWLTAKAARRAALDAPLRHFFGAELGRYLNDNRYPSLCPDLAPPLPAGAKLKWLGWDYLRHPSLPKVLRQTCETFWGEDPCG